MYFRLTKHLSMIFFIIIEENNDFDISKGHTGASGIKNEPSLDFKLIWNLLPIVTTVKYQSYYLLVEYYFDFWGKNIFNIW